MSLKSTQELIDALAASAKPIKKLMPVWAALLLIVSISTFYCFSCIHALYGAGVDTLKHLSITAVQIDVIISTICAILGLTFAIKSAYPGQQKCAKVGLFISYFGILSLLVISLGFQEWQPFSVHETITEFHCFVDIAVLASVPLIVTFLILKKLAPVDQKRTGKLAVIATVFIGYVATRINCQITEAGHSLTAHVLPLIIYGILGHFLGQKFLKW